ncbi:MAG TPA: RagB/SusD family nutrient uptake outer membrane protein [Cyclobacteriaceae bacterium]|jgi:hypothetical protein|nr:RagB/SusD family nutrient uptake outer membrane protein [Cyclobacteriaceae bacterium]
MKISNILKSLMVGIVLTSCNNQLDIQPSTSVDASQALLTSKDVKGTLVGAYANMGSTNLYGGGIYVYSDLLASTGTDINFFGTFQGLTQISNKEIPINNTFVSGVWLNAYTTINNVNEVLAALSVVNSVDRNQVEGEAKFIRASMYFELVKLFAKAWNDGDPNSNLGVPIVLNPTHSLDDANVAPARNTVKQVYDQIISDLTAAETKLPPPDNETYYYATTGAAAAQLARVYLTQGAYDLARDAAHRVISSGYYRLETNYSDEFPYIGRAVRIYNKPEDIFALQISEQQGTNNMNNYYAQSNLGGRGDIEIASDFLNTFPGGDSRLSMFTDDGSGSLFYSDKFDNLYGNVKILRLAEMYLIRAEGNLRMGTTVGNAPLSDVNIVRNRAGVTPLASVSIQNILDERRWELAFEGQWLSDYKRSATDVATVPATPWNSPSLVFPIPQREIIVNPNLIQNEGY